MLCTGGPSRLIALSLAVVAFDLSNIVQSLVNASLFTTTNYCNEVVKLLKMPVFLSAVKNVLTKLNEFFGLLTPASF